MAIWCIIFISLFTSFFLHSIFNLLKPRKPFPPGPKPLPIIGNLLWFRKSSLEFEHILKKIHTQYGSLVTLHLGSRPTIFIADRNIAHRTLVQNGSVFADRPPALPIDRIFSCNQNNINTAVYGQKWRLLRRNLMSEILNPSRVKSFSYARKWVLQILCNRFESNSAEPITAMDHFRFAMFCLLVLMCFGIKPDEKQIEKIESLQRRQLLSFQSLGHLNFWPKLTKIMYSKSWKELYQIRKDQENELIPLIRARINKVKDEKQENVVCYVDTLLDLNLGEPETVSCCTEFLNAGTDTTSTALEWIMANIVKHPEIQTKLFTEIKGVMDSKQGEVEEDDLQKLPYLKMVILEGLRRHPPAHFLLPHAVTEDVEIDGYLIPKNGTVNFMVAEMGWDPEAWKDPMEFRPERFRGEEGEGQGFDVTGSRVIRMMPFGAGRRICPGHGLAMLHLEYFVANLVWYFEWTAVDGDDVDLEENQEFTIVMKHHLRTRISPRSKD